MSRYHQVNPDPVFIMLLVLLSICRRELTDILTARHPGTSLNLMFYSRV